MDGYWKGELIRGWIGQSNWRGLGGVGVGVGRVEEVEVDGGLWTGVMFMITIWGGRV